ncbi:MAG: hypothetical protein CM15mP115_24300 [Alphaproteobacteria bacterium]|nr:MAG: hypothetical protein CM15mP115_24300 [Alphaproteobacteria bacterium]
MNFIGRFLWLILTIAAISLAMVFAVSNTQQVTLQFWPFTGQLEIAAWVLVIGAMATGALFGGGIVWLSLVAARTRNWALQRRLGKAEKRAATAEDQLAATSAGTGTDPKQPSCRRHGDCHDRRSRCENLRHPHSG